MPTVQREYVYVWMALWMTASGDQNISGSGNTVDCVGMLKNDTVAN